MTLGPKPTAANTGAPQESHGRREFVRVIAYGRAGDGKNTLISRLLQESRDVQWERSDAPDAGSRILSTGRRVFNVTEATDEIQASRALVVGTPAANAVILVVDARGKFLTQVLRLCYLASLVGIRHVALAVNKMDLVGHSELHFREIEAQFVDIAKQSGLAEATCFPVSALLGENLLVPSAHTPWYHGSTLMDWLNTIEMDDVNPQQRPFRLPVEKVTATPGIPGAGGEIVSGTVKPGDRVRVQPAGKESRVVSIATADGNLERAVAGQAVTLTLSDAIDIAPGDLISAADVPAQVADQFEATVVWLHEQPMLRGRSYLMRIGSKTVAATISPLKYRVNVNTLEHVAAEKLDRNEIGVCELELDQPIAFDSYAENRNTGGFVLIDRMTNSTVGAGMLQFALRRAHNIHVQHVDVDKAARSALKRQKACVLWLTGLSGAGKSTISNLVEKKLHAMGHHTYILDGDNVRHGLTKDLGFTAADRVENIRRIAEVAKLMVDAGLIVLTAFISPFRAERRMARGLLREGEFIEIFVDSTLSVAEQRDPKGLYKKARRGEIKNFTGIDSPYEEPESPEIHIDTARLTPEEAADRVLTALRTMGIVS